jgi:hypothetical protein
LKDVKLWRDLAWNANTSWISWRQQQKKNQPIHTWKAERTGGGLLNGGEERCLVMEVTAINTLDASVREEECNVIIKMCAEDGAIYLITGMN